MFGILAIFLLALLSVASLQQAWPAEMPAGAPPMPAGVPTAPAEPTVPPPSSPELDEAIRLANETINRHSATKLSDLIDISAPKLTCFECNCTFGYTSQMLLGDVVYSINFFLNFVQSVTVTGGTVQVKGGYNTIVVTTDRKLEAMPVRDVRAYDSFEIYMEDEEAAEKVAHHLMTARSLCTK
jgi:hypothetical protein